LTKQTHSPSSVAILLCSYEGEKYIEEQLTSITSQTYPNWKVYISDDGSKDRTLRVIQKFKRRQKIHLEIYEGPKKGFSSNFISLTKRHEIKSTFYAWADQDDIWNKRKLEKAVRWLNHQSSSRPLLYCSRTIFVDDMNRYIQPSPLFKKPKTFQNALVQNIAGGNTMIFNEKARQLFIKSSKNRKIFAHDWLMYQVITACGGIVYYDEKPSLRYRQHANNAIGMNHNMKAKIKHLKLMWHGKYRVWNSQNIAALDQIYNHMTIQNQITFDHFKRLKKISLLKRFLFFKKSGIYRQTLLQNISLVLTLLLNKI
jgi:glycosyltransferase involved in cell wall biosynthesis